jgi:signal transduction histidine kinase
VGPRIASLARPWARPAAIALVAGLITVFGTAGGPHRLLTRPLDLLAVALLVGAAGVVVFVRWPVPALTGSLACTAAYAGLGYQADSPYFVSLTVCAYLSGTAGARLRTAAFAFAVGALFAAASLLSASPERTSALGTAAIVIAALAAGQAAAELRARADRRAQEAREEEARRRVADERLRIAREMHDVVSHSIAMINVQAGVAVHVMDQQPAQAREALLAIKAASRDAMRDLRGILGLLRQLDESEPRTPVVGLVQLPELVENIRRAGVRVSLEQDMDDTPLPVSVDVAAYRVIQEALTNVVRHAQGAAAQVRVQRCPAELIVEVRDDGGRPGGDSRHGAGQGLSGMRERVRAAGGTFQAGPRSEGGFGIRARMPLPEETP